MTNRLKKTFFSFAFIAISLAIQPLPSISSSDHLYFVTVSTEWCYACKLLKPVIEELKIEYGGNITFINLDPTSEESLNQSTKIAEQYGLTNFFNNNKGAFPTVGILCPGATVAEQVIVGANSKGVYKETIERLLNNETSTCNFTGRPGIAINGSTRPDEPDYQTILGYRPDEPRFLDRPLESGSTGRPQELTFWTVGQTIPVQAYFQYLVLPKCSDPNNIICSNTTNSPMVLEDKNKPVYKPWRPDYTRDEKGYKLVRN